MAASLLVNDDNSMLGKNYYYDLGKMLDNCVLGRYENLEWMLEVVYVWMKDFRRDQHNNWPFKQLC